MNSTIAILLSTYNGEKYLSEQIESIIHQTASNWVLYIRDDGSTDSTNEIITKYEKVDKRVRRFTDNKPETNLGPMKSFFYMLKNVDSFYYMFCDQDDVWLPTKIMKTMQKMEQLEIDSKYTPCLVHTELTVVNASLQPLTTVKRDVQDDLRTILLANDITGCTVLINKALRSLALESIDTVSVMHDMWLGLLAAKFGRVAYVDGSTMLYRQHAENVVGTSGNRIDKIRRITSKSEKTRIITSINAARALLEYYSGRFSSSEQYYIRTVADIGSSVFVTCIAKMIRAHVFKHTVTATIAFWVKIGINYKALSSF